MLVREVELDQSPPCWPSPLVLEELVRTGLLRSWLDMQVRQHFADLPWRSQIADAVQSRFLQRQTGLDRVVMSLLQLDDPELAQELYFRLREQEADFPELCIHSLGSERHTLGRVGPVALESLSALLCNVIRSCRIGELHPPLESDQGTILVLRLEERLPAQLDAATRSRLEDELLHRWIRELERQLTAAPPASGAPLPIAIELFQAHAIATAIRAEVTHG